MAHHCPWIENCVGKLDFGGWGGGGWGGDKCVAGIDYHYPWIENCVSECVLEMGGGEGGEEQVCGWNGLSLSMN